MSDHDLFLFTFEHICIEYAFFNLNLAYIFMASFKQTYSKTLRNRVWENWYTQGWVSNARFQLHDGSQTWSL